MFYRHLIKRHERAIMAIKDDIAALQDQASKQDDVITSLNMFIAGIPALIDTAVAAQEDGDESALEDLKAHFQNNTSEISQAVVTGTSASAPHSGVNDDPVAAANPAVVPNPNPTTYADNGDVVPVEATPGAEPVTPAAAPDATSDVPAGETPVPADRVAVDDDHQIAAPAATDAAPDADVTTDPNHVTLEPGETATVDTKPAS